MVALIDQGQWTKLLNRRVQHFGYEFKYGTNNVDPNSQIGGLPPFCDPIVPRMENSLRAFKESNEPQSAQMYL